MGGVLSPNVTTSWQRSQTAPTRSVSRRSFLGAGAATGAAGIFGARARTALAAEASPVFAHSVASGDPYPDSVVLWTRVTPTPEAHPGSGLGPSTRVRWELSSDPGFGILVAFGETFSDAGSDHTIKVVARGLAPATTYFFRFSVLDGPASGAVSRTGRTRTAPAVDAQLLRLRFGVCSCSNYEAGYFRAYRDMADRDDLEFTLHLGDFTYEYASGEYGADHKTTVRRVEPAQRTTTLTDYRIRQGHYHTDPDLADLLAAKPLIAIWDDHEFADNSWREGATGNSIDIHDDFPAMKAQATQAYFEWMPVRAGEGFGTADDRHLYRHLRYGDLAELIIPDLRSFRDYQVLMTPSNSGLAADPDYLRAVGAPDRSMLGGTQFQWFADALATSGTRWQLIGNEVMFAPLTLPPTLDPHIHEWLVHQIGLPAEGIALNADQWDGYMAERSRIVELIAAEKKPGVVFLTGDIHSSWAADIPANAGQFRLGQDNRVVATEFITPSVTAGSAFDSLASNPALDVPVRELLRVGQDLIRSVDTWYRYIDLTSHGYMAVEATAERVQVDWLHGDVLEPSAGVSHSASYQALYGAPGARSVGEELDRSAAIY
nr:alkaline phosphatase D family protein [Corynebacterium sp. UBA5992]